MEWDRDLEKDSPAYNFVVDDAKTIRVIAGPGAGKSYAMQHRIMRLLEQERVSPEKILVITYSKVAAEYLKKDIAEIKIAGADKIVATTLHGLCYDLIYKNHDIAPERCLRTMQPFEQKALLYDLSEEYGVLRQKTERIRAFEAELETDISSDDKFKVDVVEWAKRHNTMLWGEVITQTIKYLANNPSCPEMNIFEHVLVDEYQDLNKSEQKVVDLLSANGKLVVIGDDDQSIYGFKHANPDGIRNFHEAHKDCSEHRFTECRRCPKAVVEKASCLIEHNEDRAYKDFVPYKDNQVGEIEIITSETFEDEIRDIAKMIKAEKDSGAKIKYEDFLVLAPTQNIADKLRDELCELGVEAKSLFKESILQNNQLKRTFSLLSLMANPDDMVSLRYLLGQGGDKFRAKSYKRVLDYASENGLAVVEVLDKCAKGEIKIPYIHHLIFVYSELTRELSALKSAISASPMDLLDILTEDTPTNHVFRELLNEAINKNKFTKKMGLEKWLKQVYENVSKLISLPENLVSGEFVKIMSLHSAKGLSAKYLVIMGAAKGLLPREPFGLKDNYKKHLEEKRRLFYVAVTRCKGNQPDYPGKLIVSTVEGKESRFIRELFFPKQETISKTNAGVQI